ncbi:unnamed protein product, partial [Mesorhabditis spiculigera]
MIAHADPGGPDVPWEQEWQSSGQVQVGGLATHPCFSNITVVTFDPFQDLLWVGTEAGHVISYYKDYELRTSFEVFGQGEYDKPIRAFHIFQDSVLAVTSKKVGVWSKEGIHFVTMQTPEFVDLRCVFVTPVDPLTVIFAGNQPHLVKCILPEGEDPQYSKYPLPEVTEVTHLKGNAKLIFAGSASGKIVVMNIDSFATVRVISVQTAAINDIDVGHDYLTFCGMFLKNGVYEHEPFVKIFSLRDYRMIQAVSVTRPRLCKIVKEEPEGWTVLIVSDSGSIFCYKAIHGRGASLVFASGIGVSNVQQLDCCCISSNNKAVALGVYGQLFITSPENTSGHFTDNPMPTHLPDPVLGPPLSITYDDEATSFAAVPMPFPHSEDLLSDWPEEQCRPNYKVPRQTFDIKNVTVRQFVGYSKNPLAHLNLRNYNLVPYELDDSESIMTVSRLQAVVPIFYQKRLSDYVAKQRVRKFFDESHFVSLNPYYTEHTGVEPNCESGVLQPLVMVFFWTMPLRNIIMQHTCFDDDCLVCQLMFIFRFLAESNTATPTSLVNMIRVMNTNYSDSQFLQVRAHALFSHLMSSIEKSLSQQLFNEFIDTLRVERLVSQRCVRCDAVSENDDTFTILQLDYPPEALNLPFLRLMEKALTRKSCGEVFCQSCEKATTHTNTAKVKRIPPVLMVDCNQVHEQFPTYWSTRIEKDERRVPYTIPKTAFVPPLDTGLKNCMHGAVCHHPRCSYEHPPKYQQLWDEVNEWQRPAELPELKEGEWAHVLPEKIYVSAEHGIPKASETPLDAADSAEYTLVVLTTVIGDPETGRWDHAVPMVREIVNGKATEKWVVLNELFHAKIPTNEALHINQRWKLPHVLVYVRKDQLGIAKCQPATIPLSIFTEPFSLSGDLQLSRTIPVEQIPGIGQGRIVGIDAEFIEVSRGGPTTYKSVARLSIVRNDGSVILDDLVELCPEEYVRDFATNVSGVVADDLKRQTSKKLLTTMKRVLMKVHCLIERDVIFVGHGIANDFWALNVFVPERNVVDTVKLFRSPVRGSRQLSLQYLVLMLLDQKIHRETHDSIVDAQMPLLLYKIYQDSVADGTLETKINFMYDHGMKWKWRGEGMVRTKFLVKENEEGAAQSASPSPQPESVNSAQS